jgi:hypothetical protein
LLNGPAELCCLTIESDDAGATRYGCAPHHQG